MISEIFCERGCEPVGGNSPSSPQISHILNPNCVVGTCRWTFSMMSSDPFSVLVRMDSGVDTVGRETHSGKGRLKKWLGSPMVGHPCSQAPLTASKLHWPAESRKKSWLVARRPPSWRRESECTAAQTTHLPHTHRPFSTAKMAPELRKRKSKSMLPSTRRESLILGAN